MSRLFDNVISREAAEAQAIDDDQPELDDLAFFDELDEGEQADFEVEPSIADRELSPAVVRTINELFGYDSSPGINVPVPFVQEQELNPVEISSEITDQVLSPPAKIGLGVPVDDVQQVEQTNFTPATTPQSRAREMSYAQRVAQNSAVLDLKIGSVGFRAPLSSALVIKENDADPDMLRVSKDLIDREELKAINRHKTAFIKWLKLRAFNVKMLRGGMLCLPLNLIEEVNTGIQNFIAERARLVEAFLADYDRIKREAAEKLGPRYQPDEYPTSQEIREAFQVKYKYLDINVPAAIEARNAEIFATMRDQLQAEFQEAGQEMRDAMRVGFANLVDYIVEATSAAGEDGKEKSLDKRGIEKLAEFIDLFPQRDLTNDDELRQLIERARELTSGHMAKEIRSNEALRDNIQLGFSQIAEQLATHLEVKPTRRMRANRPAEPVANPAASAETGAILCPLKEAASD